MSTQKTDDQIQFDIEYDANQQPYIKPSKDREKKLRDTAVDTIFQSVTNSYQEIMKEVLKHQSNAVKVINSIKLTAIFCTTDYAKYLYEEKKKYGDAGIKDEKIALAQTIVGCTLSNGAGAAALAKGKGLKVAIGASTAVSVAYDNYDIFDKPLKDHIGSLTAFLVGKKKNRDYKKAIEPDSEGIRTKQEIKADNTAQIKLFTEKVSLPNLIKDNPNFVSNTEGLNEFNRILSVLDRNVAKKITNELLSKNTAAGSCTAKVETGGSCKAENLDDIQGKGTYFNPSVVQKLYQTLDKKGIILDRAIISDYTTQGSSAHEDINSKTHVVEKGDTFWSVANSNDIGVNELLSISGNEKYLDRRYIDERGKDNIKLYPDDIINLPSDSRSINSYYNVNQLTEGFNRLNLHHQTPFKDKILSSFELGNYGNYQELHTYLLMPFLKWSSSSQFKTLDDQLQLLREVGFEREYGTYSFKDFLNTHSDKFNYESNKDVQHSSNLWLTYNLNMLGGFRSAQEYSHYSDRNYQIHREFKHFNPPLDIGGHWERQFYGRHGGKAKYISKTGGFTMEISYGRPIGISLSNKDIDLVKYESSSIFFDMDGDGYKENTAWVSGSDAILVYDYNENGIVDEAKKIVFTEWSKESKTDLEALKKAFDSNNDNIFDSKDQEYGKFFIWQDYNQNGISEDNELNKLSDAGLISINLNIASEDSETKKEHGILGTSDISWKDGSITKAYDLLFKHSLLGIKTKQLNSDIIINYIEKGSQLKFFIPEGEESIHFNSKESDYDVLLGTTFNDIIDVSQAKGVLVEAGDGDDIIKVASGNNWVKGGPGKDSIATGAGHDLLFIDAEDTEINAGEGFDVAFVMGDKGININIAKANLEAIYGSHKDDNIDGSQSDVNVQIHGGDGDDTLIGGSGDDIIVGGKGQDKIMGGKGDDKIFIDSEDNLSDIDCGDGNDTIYLIDDKGINIDLDKINAENFFGNKGDDKITAKGNKNSILLGGDGNDEIIGGSSNNIIDGGKGADILRGGSGNNRYMFSLGYGNDMIYAAGKNRGDKKDLILLSSDIKLDDISFNKNANDLILKVSKEDSLTIKNWYTSDSNKVDGIIYQADNKETNKEIILYEEKSGLTLKDSNNWIIFTTTSEDMYLLGGDGEDFIKTGAGNDLILGGGEKPSNDVIYAGDGDDTILACDADTDACKNGVSSVRFYGENGNDYLRGSGGNDILDGGAGTDIIFGFGGDDIIYLSKGPTLESGKNEDIYGGKGNDLIIFNDCGISQVHGNEGNDIFKFYPCKENIHSIAIIRDFEINNPNEKIDFSEIHHIRSLEDLIMFNTQIEIDPSKNIEHEHVIKVETEKKEVPGFGLCWQKNPSYHCAYLAEVTEAQIKQHPENFIFYKDTAFDNL